MKMAETVRKIVQIDEEKCDGCGLCVPSCHEGAIQIIDGKARLIEDKLCDGLGDCLGECPQDAITIVEREAEEYDEAAVEAHLEQLRPPSGSSCSGGGCPGAAMLNLAPEASDGEPAGAQQQSQLTNWPVQLALVPPHAPWLEGADLLISADCVPYALGSFHRDLLEGKRVITACPKLDNIEPYLEKLTEIFRTQDLKRVTVARMEVPCCSGLAALVRRAVDDAGTEIAYDELIIEIGG